MIERPVQFADTPSLPWVTRPEALSEVLKAVKLDGVAFYNGDFSASWCAYARMEGVDRPVP